jgi:hypothetical protein
MNDLQPLLGKDATGGGFQVTLEGEGLVAVGEGDGGFEAPWSVF